MFNNLADRLNSTGYVVKQVQQRYPDEQVLFVSSATLLESGARAGWSLRRLIQHRGVAVVTTQRIIGQASTISLYSLLYLMLGVMFLAGYVQSGDIVYLVFALLLLPFLVQRMPYRQDVPFTAVQKVQTGRSRGTSGSISLLAIRQTSGPTLNIILARALTPAMLEKLIPADLLVAETVTTPDTTTASEDDERG
jgi:hypothetical protein